MHIHFSSVLEVVVLFFLGLTSPGPNFFVVVESTLASGRRSGLVTGLGAALGDAIYASCGLFGMGVLIVKGGAVLVAIKLAGGAYLMWLGLHMLLRWKDSRDGIEALAVSQKKSLLRQFARGLSTDIANPKTIIFFASIFALAVHPGTPVAERLLMLLGIVATSVLWRSTLTMTFGAQPVRLVYQRSQRRLEQVFGAILILFGAQLARRAMVS